MTSQLNWAFGLAKTPEGKHWISCQLINPMSTYSFAMPPDAWEELLKSLPDTIQKASAEARRLDSGLEVAGPEALKNIQKNGGKPNVRIR